LSLIYCVPDGALVGPNRWLPTEPFDYGWWMFGCNQLRCGSCNHQVRASVPDGKRYRHYECACQSRDEAHDYFVLGADQGQVQELVTKWHCGGHPQMPLPVDLDGVQISAVGPFTAIVERTLASPPFLAPGFPNRSFWVQRLYCLLPTAAQKAMVGKAVAAQLSSPDPAMINGAFDFFHDQPRAPGGDEVIAIAKRDRDRLRATPDPSLPEQSLYDRALEVTEQLLVPPLPGQPAGNATALELGHSSLLAGEASNGMVFRIAKRDPSWFAAHAADIVRARPEDVDFVVEALKDFPEAARDEAFRDVAALGEAARASVDSAIEERAEH
jgi:hypothetical protein